MGNGICQEDRPEAHQERGFLQDSADTDLSLSEYFIFKSTSSSSGLVTQTLSRGSQLQHAREGAAASTPNLLCLS